MKIEEKANHAHLLCARLYARPFFFLFVMSPLQCPIEVAESSESCFSGGKI